jgi:uncharacterized protein
VTPLLPCGLLYGVFALATATQRAADGGLVLFAFALGAMPALIAAQLQLRWFGRRETRWTVAARRAIPLLAALVIVYRAMHADTQPCH